MENLKNSSFQHVPFLRITLFFGLGITTASIGEEGCELLPVIGVFLLLLSLFIWLLFYLGYQRVGTMLLYATLFIAGFYHYATHVKHPDFQIDRPQTFVARITEEPRVSPGAVRTSMRLMAWKKESEWLPTDMPIVASFWRKDSLATLQLGDTIAFRGAIKMLEPPLNPEQFDYARYLKSKGIFYDVFAPLDAVKVLGSAEKGKRVLHTMRMSLHRKFSTYIPDSEAQQIAAAIGFGYRANLSQDVLEAFANTGTIHVLSVSGFHVSLMFLLVTMLFKPMDRIPYGRSFRFVLVLLLIWLYAAICGFEPAVLRATVMFSIFLIGYWHTRTVLSLNTLFLSMFILLVIDPFMLFDVGFQLSYLAVLGILLFYPILQAMYLPKRRKLQHLVNLCYVSIAAQLTTTSLALFYFHQFPTYFLPANLLLTFPSTAILYLGFFLMLCPVDVLNSWVGYLLEKLILYSFQLLQWIDSLPFASLQGLPSSLWALLLSYGVLLLLILAIRRHAKAALMVAGIMFIGLLQALFWHRWQEQGFRGVKIYQMHKQIAIALIDRGAVTVISTLDSLNHAHLRYTVHPDLKRYAALELINFEHLVADSTDYFISWQDTLRIQVKNLPGSTSSNADLTLVRKNAQIFPTDAHGFVIFDASNSQTYLDQVQAELARGKLPYYILKDNFAYVWRWEL